MFQLIAYAESIAPAGALVNVAAVADDTLSTLGDDVHVLEGIEYLIGELGLIDATGAERVQIQSPSLRRMANLDVAPFNTGVTFTNPDSIRMHPELPRQLVADESVEALVKNTEAIAVEHYVGLIMADGSPVKAGGEIFTIRATSSMTANADEWVSGPLTFDTDLPVGNYNVVGMRVEIAAGVFARLIFKGGTYRPGCPVSITTTAKDNMHFRNGMLGVWGNFNSKVLPSIEVIAAAGAVTPVVYLDLVAT